MGRTPLNAVDPFGLADCPPDSEWDEAERLSKSASGGRKTPAELSAIKTNFIVAAVIGVVDAAGTLIGVKGPGKLLEKTAEAVAKEAAERKLLSEARKLADKELKNIVGDVHAAKAVIGKQFNKELKGDKNFDILVDKAGNMVLKGNKSGTLVQTGVPASTYAP